MLVHFFSPVKTCSLLILFLIFVHGCSSKQSGQNDHQTQTAAGPNRHRHVPLLAADTSGQPMNLAEFGGLIPGKPQAYDFHLESASDATLLLTHVRHTYGTCTQKIISIRYFLRVLTKAGLVARVDEIVPLVPLKISQGDQVLRLIVEVDEPCQGASQRFALIKLGETSGENLPAIPKQTPEGNAGDLKSTKTGNAGNGVRNPHLPTEPTDPHGPDEGQNSCPWPLHQEPSHWNATLIYYGSLSKRDACHEIFRWRAGDYLAVPSPPNCQAPVLQIEPHTETNRQIKMSEVWQDDLQGNLAWLNTHQDPIAISEALEGGESLALISDREGCDATDVARLQNSDDTAQNVHTILTLQNSLDLLLFRGEPKDLVDGYYLAPTQATVSTNAGDFHVSYAYSFSDPDTDNRGFYFSWSFRLQAQDQLQALGQGAQGRFYNSKARAFISDWIELDTANFPQLHYKVENASVLRRLLPRQRDLEFVIRQKPCTQEPCPHASPNRWLIRYQNYFFANELDGNFKDMTNPEKPRFELVEGDLPTE